MQSYRYDDQGRRISKTVGSSATSYLYSGADIVGEYRNWSSPAAVFTHGPTTDSPVIRSNESGSLYYLQDGLGSVVASTDRYGNGDAPINVASAANGARVTTSSWIGQDVYALKYVNNGDRTGINQSYWQDNTYESYPDWVEITFNGVKTINEVDVFTIQDDLSHPGLPTELSTFQLYGITAFDVQYWDGGTWSNVPGGSITGNTNVWKKITFSPLTTGKIRVKVNAGTRWYSRIAEIEAYDLSHINVALADNGGIADSSSTFVSTNRVPSNLIDGNRRGENGVDWVGATNPTSPDWVQIDFSGEKEITELDVFSSQGGAAIVEPTESLLLSNIGVTAFEVQSWDGAIWKPVQLLTTSGGRLVSGKVTANDKVWCRVTFSELKTTKIRVVINGIMGSQARMAEIEVYTPAKGGTQRFDAWGNKVAATGNPIPQYGFTGREPDETGLVYYRARYYDPTIGRFTQRDPIGLRGGINQYGYVGGNPVNLVDPNGERPLTNGEIGILTPMFHGSVDYSKIDVQNGANWNPIAWIAHLTGHPAITLGNTVYVNSSDFPKTGDFSTAPTMSQALLVHETTHVWQKQTNPEYSEIKAGIEGLSGADAYKYSLSPNTPSTIAGPPKPLTSYGFEQQAQIVENSFLASRGRTETGYPLSSLGECQADYYNSHMSTISTSGLDPWGTSGSGSQSLATLTALPSGGRSK